jgi:hypothetical protein
MKFFFAIVLIYCSLLASRTFAFGRPNIDTVSIVGLTPGLDGAMVATYTSQKMDTLLWSEDGTGITKFSGSYLAIKGDFRIAYSKGIISQVSFVAPAHDQTETKKIYEQLSRELEGVFGTADVMSNGVVREMRWEGMKQSISIKAVDDMPYVTVALSTFEKK